MTPQYLRNIWQLWYVGQNKIVNNKITWPTKFAFPSSYEETLELLTEPKPTVQLKKSRHQQTNSWNTIGQIAWLESLQLYSRQILAHSTVFKKYFL